MRALVAALKPDPVKCYCCLMLLHMFQKMIFYFKVICVLTEPDEFKKYSGMDGLLDFYREECGLIVYNRSIPDFQIPTSGDLVNNILDLTYHLSQAQ